MESESRLWCRQLAWTTPAAPRKSLTHRSKWCGICHSIGGILDAEATDSFTAAFKESIGKVQPCLAGRRFVEFPQGEHSVAVEARDSTFRVERRRFLRRSVRCDNCSTIWRSAVCTERCRSTGQMERRRPRLLASFLKHDFEGRTRSKITRMWKFVSPKCGLPKLGEALAKLRKARSDQTFEIPMSEPVPE